MLSCKLIRKHCRVKITKVPKIEGCRQLAIALSVSQILKNVHRSMQPELISHRVDTGDFNSIDLMFRHHICSSHALQTPLGGSKEVGGKGNFKIICLGIANDLKSGKYHF